MKITCNFKRNKDGEFLETRRRKHKQTIWFCKENIEQLFPQLSKANKVKVEFSSRPENDFIKLVIGEYNGRIKIEGVRRSFALTFSTIEALKRSLRLKSEDGKFTLWFRIAGVE